MGLLGLEAIISLLSSASYGMLHISRPSSCCLLSTLVKSSGLSLPFQVEDRDIGMMSRGQCGGKLLYTCMSSLHRYARDTELSSTEGTTAPWMTGLRLTYLDRRYSVLNLPHLSGSSCLWRCGAGSPPHLEFPPILIQYHILTRRITHLSIRILPGSTHQLHMVKITRTRSS